MTRSDSAAYPEVSFVNLTWLFKVTRLLIFRFILQGGTTGVEKTELTYSQSLATPFNTLLNHKATFAVHFDSNSIPAHTNLYTTNR